MLCEIQILASGTHPHHFSCCLRFQCLYLWLIWHIWLGCLTLQCMVSETHPLYSIGLLSGLKYRLILFRLLDHFRLKQMIQRLNPLLYGIWQSTLVSKTQPAYFFMHTSFQWLLDAQISSGTLVGIFSVLTQSSIFQTPMLQTQKWGMRGWRREGIRWEELVFKYFDPHQLPQLHLNFDQSLHFLKYK